MSILLAMPARIRQWLHHQAEEQPHETSSDEASSNRAPPPASFEDFLEEFYTKLDLKGKTVIDIGAHAGRHAIPLAQLVGVEGIVLAFEPVPAVRHGLHEKLVQSGCNNVVVLPFALSDRTERGEFNFIPNLPEEGGLKRRHRYNAEPEAFIPVEVAVKRLDDMVPVGADIVFIKIDVEGAELAVLEGAQGILQKNRPVVAFECGAGSFLGYHDRPEDIWKLFDQLDYRIISITGEMMHTAEKFRKESHVQKFWDYIAIHKRDEQATKYLTGSS